MPHESPEALYGQEPKPVRLFRLHRASVRTFQGNAEDLDTAMADLEAALRSQAEREAETFPDPLSEQHRLVGRQLFNYIAAMGALIDHSQRIVRTADQANADFMPEYRQRLVRFSEPELALVRGLRNFTLHYALPVTYSSLRHGVSHPEPEATLLLGAVELRVWDGWTGPVKAHLAGLDSDIALRPLVAGYTAAVAGLHSWWGPLLRAWAELDVGSDHRALPPSPPWPARGLPPATGPLSRPAP